MTIGQRIAEVREQRGLSQNALAQKAGIAQGYLSDLEAGNRPNPGYSSVKRIARALGVSLAELDPDLNTESLSPAEAVA